LYFISITVEAFDNETALYNRHIHSNRYNMDREHLADLFTRHIDTGLVLRQYQECKLQVDPKETTATLRCNRNIHERHDNGKLVARPATTVESSHPASISQGDTRGTGRWNP
jgi:hypothetical protein